MTNIVKRFIENHIDLIEDGKIYELLSTAYNNILLTNIDVAELLSILYVSQVASADLLNTTREEFLMNELESNLIADAQTKEFTMFPLRDYVEITLGNCLGCTVPEVVDMILKNAERYEKYVYIFFDDNGIPMLERW